jgi:hypothetical protein
LELFGLLPDDDIYDWGVLQGLFDSLSLYKLKLDVECVADLDYYSDGNGGAIRIPCWLIPTIFALLLAISNLLCCVFSLKLRKRVIGLKLED